LWKKKLLIKKQTGVSSSSRATRISDDSSSNGTSSSGNELLESPRDSGKLVEQVKASIHEAEKRIKKIQIEVAYLREQNHPNADHLIQK
jgi:hypothetical protein